MSKPRVGVYPGTFDPITKGHMDIISRAARVLDRLIVGVAQNPGKGPLFGVDERVELIEGEITGLRASGHDITVQPFDNLLIHFAQECDANILVRGLRAVSDFEYEFQMASMNSRLDPDIETLFLPASERQQFIAAGLVKEIARLGGDVTEFVSAAVAERLASKFGPAGARPNGKGRPRLRKV